MNNIEKILTDLIIEVQRIQEGSCHDQSVAVFKGVSAGHIIIETAMNEEIQRLRKLLVEVINQACLNDDNVLDTYRIPSLENAMIYLESIGKVKEVKAKRLYRWTSEGHQP